MRDAFESSRALRTAAAFAATTPSAAEVGGRWHDGSVWVAVDGGRIVGRVSALYERCGIHRTDTGPSDLAGTPLFTMEKRF